uniref:NADH-ubiquinone oxidoreductase chain 5 n=1 Tax=Megalyra sp. MM-2014 TaxID=1503221 RepID=A0A096XL91_9HYME|nr:NADH dehydrogenase subunit 5 [Megalyra sp. MM-2014]
MMMAMNQLLILSILWILMMILSIYMNFWSISIMIKWNILSFNSMNYEIMLYIDWISILFISIIFLITSNIFWYSIEYMLIDKSINLFMWLINLFMLSMIILIISPNIFSMIMGWDGLGLISYCLVIFYQNSYSYNAGMLTVISNRIGDINLLILISLLISLGSWNLMFYNNLNKINFMPYFLIMTAFTKSAQYPFSLWLPAAMAAPTPVSSLVHSSTLVTAGIYILIRFNSILNTNNFLILILSSMTSMYAGMMANFEFDIKKIIAFSTLSQISIMMFILALNLPMISLFHLFTHAIFKSKLFMCSGILIHEWMNNQNIKYLGNLINFKPLMITSFNLANLSLCGLPFLSGFYSKDLIIEFMMMNKINMIIFLMMMISMGLTLSYTIRMIKFSFMNNLNLINPLFFNNKYKYMNLSLLNLSINTIMSGSLMSWLFFYKNNLIVIPWFFKTLIIWASLIGIIMGNILFSLNTFSIKILFFIKSLFLLNFKYLISIKNYLKFSYFYLPFENSWLEFTLNKTPQIFFNKFSVNLFNEMLLKKNY